MPYHSRLLPDMIILPGQPIPKTLVINFDETIIHSEYHLGQGMINLKRPHLVKFLEELANVYEIIVFSSKEDSTVNYFINYFF
jgi:TFIIF-interacting CTD phosphatase-like protein